MSDVFALLGQLGFGDYEARVYVALLQHGPANGYELAKLSGVPRPNVYSLLPKLEERGAIRRLDDSQTTRYVALPYETLLQQLGSHYQDTLRNARHELEAIAQPEERPYVWNTESYSVLLEHARALVDNTEETLLVGIWPDEARALADTITEAQARGVDVTTLCLAACTKECGGCQGRIYRYRVLEEQSNRWLMFVPDGQEVLAGEILDDQTALAVRTRQKLLVDLATWFIRHSIALAAVINDLGEELFDLLSPDSRAILESIGPGEASGNWLNHMRRLLRRGATK